MMSRDDLKRMKQLNKAGDAMRQRVELLYQSAQRTTTLLDGLPKGSIRRSILEEAIVAIRTELDTLEGMIAELEVLRRVLSKALTESNLSTLECLVIQLRYSDGQSFNAIAKLANLTVGHVFKIHRRALMRIVNDSK